MTNCAVAQDVMRCSAEPVMTVFLVGVVLIDYLAAMVKTFLPEVAETTASSAVKTLMNCGVAPDATSCLAKTAMTF